jgi:6,7-dimethyl-8-ribityllumazine synthase
MVQVYQGNLSASPGRFAVVVSRFNESITARLLAGAVETLTAHGVGPEQIDVFWTPGAFEIPTVAGRLAAAGGYAAILCLGAVIRGETTHDQHINRAVSIALAELGARWGLPVLFGVLTCDTLEQALARSGAAAATAGKDQGRSRPGNKGVDCAQAALEMVSLLAKLPQPKLTPRREDAKRRTKKRHNNKNTTETRSSRSKKRVRRK